MDIFLHEPDFLSPASEGIFTPATVSLVTQFSCVHHITQDIPCGSALAGPQIIQRGREKFLFLVLINGLLCFPLSVAVGRWFHALPGGYNLYRLRRCINSKIDFEVHPEN